MTSPSLSSPTSVWGDEIVVNHVGGIPYRMYAERPRRLEELLAFADRWGDRLHIVQGDRRVTFADLRRDVAAKAVHLRAEGLQPGEFVFLLGWNSPDWVINFWAVLEAGAVPVLANGWWSEQEVADAMERVHPALTLADARGLTKLPRGTRTAPWETTAPEGSSSTPTSGAGSRDEEEPAVVIFTSGTSGRPKAVLLSHRALLAGLQQLLHVSRRLPHQVDETSGDVGLHTGPLFHIGGVQTLQRAITVGGTLVMPSGRFDPAEALELIETYQVSRWSAVPTMVSRVLEHPDVATRDVGSLRSLTVGGAPVHVELLDRIRTGLPGAGARVPTGFGLTENGGQATAASGRDTAERPGGLGRPLPCVDVSFVKHEGLPDAEVLLRAPTQMSGYLGEDESPIDDEGWLHTGDLGRLDEDGHLWITGRSKDLIIRGGENIAPVAVERALMAIPGVTEVAVVGLPDPDLGEEVKAYVVTEGQGHTSDTLTAALRGTLASFAVPTRWHIQSEPLPTNHAGKVDKAALADLPDPADE